MKIVRKTALVGHGTKVHLATSYDGGRFFTACGAGENSTLTRNGRSSIHTIKDLNSADDVTCQRCRKDINRLRSSINA